MGAKKQSHISILLYTTVGTDQHFKGHPQHTQNTLNAPHTSRATLKRTHTRLFLIYVLCVCVCAFQRSPRAPSRKSYTRTKGTHTYRLINTSSARANKKMLIYISHCAAHQRTLRCANVRRTRLNILEGFGGVGRQNIVWPKNVRGQKKNIFASLSLHPFLTCCFVSTAPRTIYAVGRCGGWFGGGARASCCVSRV